MIYLRDTATVYYENPAALELNITTKSVIYMRAKVNKSMKRLLDAYAG